MSQWIVWRSMLASKWEQVLQLYISGTAGDRSPLVESAAHPSSVSVPVVDFMVAAVYSLPDWRGLVCFVYLVDLVHLVRFIQPRNQTDQTNQTNQMNQTGRP